MRWFFFLFKIHIFFFFVKIDLWLLIVINADTRARRVSEIKADNNTHTKKKEINDQVSGARKKKGNTKYCRVYYFITLFIFGRCVEEMMTGT